MTALAKLKRVDRQAAAKLSRRAVRRAAQDQGSATAYAERLARRELKNR